MDLFNRVVKVRVSGKTLGEPLTIYFDIPFDDSEEVNTGTIKIYNLSDPTISSIKNNIPITLSAGYQDEYGSIFQGVVKEPETTWSGVDKVTEIVCAEEHRNYLNKKVVKTFAPSTPSSTVLKYLIGEAGLGIGDLSPVTDFVYRSGKTLKGDVSTLIKSIVKDTKSKMHISRGKIYIRDPKVGDATGFVVNKESGLVDVPEKIESEEESKANGEKNTRSGWKIKMLLNHRITVDSIIVLQSKVVSGTFRVVKGRHYSEGDSFYTEAEVY